MVRYFCDRCDIQVRIVQELKEVTVDGKIYLLCSTCIEWVRDGIKHGPMGEKK